MKGLYLIGFMGAGKSTVGALLARRLGQAFIDLDEAIVADTGLDIPTIFAEQGEAAFRAHELRVLQAQQRDAVIALGGGAFIHPPIRAWLETFGASTIYLEWPFSILKQRILGDANRPLAQDEQALEQRFRDRQPIYRQARHRWISQPPHEEKPAEIVDAIVSLSQI